MSENNIGADFEDFRELELEMAQEQEQTPEKMSPVQIQQEYFENLPDCDWIKYESTNRKYLLQNIAFALFGSPSLEGDMLLPFDPDQASLEGYTTRQQEQVMNIYEKIVEQKKYSQNDEDIMMSVLLVVCARPDPLPFYKIQPKNYWVDLHQRNDIKGIWCTAVFKIRKCISTIIGEKSCKVYIDESARVYHDWDSYLKKNSLPECVMVAPQDGEYCGIKVEGEEYLRVKLTVTPSPALGLTAKVLSTADTASTVASLGALGVLGAAAFTPVGPAVLVGALAATVGTGVYGLVRSSMHLHDRRIHEQSISIANAEARGSWLNITASSVGLAAGAASTLLARSAAAGTNMTRTGQALAMSVEVLRHANIVTGGAGVVNSLIHIILKYKKHGERPTTLELFQFSAATLFFCNAVVSNRTAKTIIEDAQANTINEYRSTLRSNKHRKIFDKLSAETRRVQGVVQGNAEVIQGIKNIANKDQYFADVLKINKDINNHKLRISMTSDGQVNLNAVHKFNPSDLYGLGKDGRTELFSTLGPAHVTSKNMPTQIVPSPTAVNRYLDTEEPNNSLLVGINPGEILRIGGVLVRVSAQGAESVACLLENLSKDLYDIVMTVALNLLSMLVPVEIARLKLLSPDEDLIVQIVKFVFNYLKHQRPMGDACRDDNGIIIVLKEFFQDGVVRKDTILYLKEVLLMSIENKLNERSRRFPHKKQIICPTCNGVRFA
ncbi:uncharacterized protein LOC121732388 [Aricia agestis]|uniref:uncharacterized protein LOC121732388 n=1 Tax=Aricia agestis TaxID=91739 RepID=UPI001C201CE6|nr:uncharacterized protein LOC121732388 [Aricia agestis]